MVYNLLVITIMESNTEHWNRVCRCGHVLFLSKTGVMGISLCISELVSVGNAGICERG